MIQFPKEVCQRFYKPDPNAPNQNFILAKQTEQARENIRNAAILHGVIVGEVRHRSVEPPVAQSDDNRIEAGELGKLAGLDPSYRVTHSQYLDLRRLKLGGSLLAPRHRSHRTTPRPCDSLRIKQNKTQRQSRQRTNRE